MRTIKEGDIVNLYWVNEEQCLSVRVISIPSNFGELWYFQDSKGENKQVRAVNVICSEFNQMIKVKEADGSD